MSTDLERPDAPAAATGSATRRRRGAAMVAVVLLVCLVVAGLTYRQTVRTERQQNYELFLQSTIVATGDELVRQSQLPSAERSIFALEAVATRTMQNDASRNWQSSMTGGSTGPPFAARIAVQDFNIPPWWLGSTDNYDQLVLWLPEGSSDYRMCLQAHGDPFGGLPQGDVTLFPSTMPGQSTPPCPSESWSDVASMS